VRFEGALLPNDNLQHRAPAVSLYM
jgi:hypothetical protein